MYGGVNACSHRHNAQLRESVCGAFIVPVEILHVIISIIKGTELKGK